MNVKSIITASVALLLISSVPGQAKVKLPSWLTFWKKNKVEEVQPADTVKKKTPYEKLFAKEGRKADGMITIHQVGQKIYFELPVALFGRDFVMGSTIARISDNAYGVVGAKPSGLSHFTFEQVDSTIVMRNVSADYYSDDANISKALSESNLGAILRLFPRKAYNNDSTAVVFDVTDVFLGKDDENSPFTTPSVYGSYTRNEQYKPELSYIAGFKAFEDNVSVTSSLSYTVTLKHPTTGRTLMKDRPFTAELTRSIMLLPEEIYHPRTADPRIGYFFTEREQLGSTAGSPRSAFFANRWRLEPSDTAAYRRGEAVEPVKPIVFYIDDKFPESWKPWIRAAVNQWQKPFERIGFKNAIIAKDFPTDDPEFDPDNIKYSCIRYAPIGVQNAMGPSWVDPRSGEIITASVYVFHDVIKLASDWRFVQTAQTDPNVRTKDIPEEILGDALKYVITHEVGHCLGLMHNMSASAVIPTEALRDPVFTQENGTTTSIMDYARNNYVAQPGDFERGVKVTPPTFGKYDYWAIRWGYQPVFDVASFEEETAITSGWITDSLKADAFYRYGKQQLYAKFFDPSCQNEDLGDDVLASSAYGVASLKYIVPRFMDWIDNKSDEDYEYRVDLYKAIVSQYSRYIGHLARNIGGLYRREVKFGDGQKPFENVPRQKQLDCLERLFDMWADLDWIADESVVSRLPVIGTPVQALRNSIQNYILSAPFACGSSDGVDTRELGPVECFGIVADKVWGPTRNKLSLTPEQRRFQKDFVETYMTVASFAMPSSRTKTVAINEDAHILAGGDNLCSLEANKVESEGVITYSPVSGFEYYPRSIFNMSSNITVADIYALLSKARSDMKAALTSASEQDKAHYQLLISTISYGIKD
ncbi:MAG: zinc-dependent metalloprotease [Bacteroidales bacterium]|nr:zinc-dependent metalloprotease [Bacteroidales bacterium]